MAIRCLLLAELSRECANHLGSSFYGGVPFGSASCIRRLGDKQSFLNDLTTLWLQSGEVKSQRLGDTTYDGPGAFASLECVLCTYSCSCMLGVSWLIYQYFNCCKSSNFLGRSISLFIHGLQVLRHHMSQLFLGIFLAISNGPTALFFSLI